MPQGDVARGALGAIFRPQRAPEELMAAAVEVENSGVDQLWLWEDCFLQGGLTSAAVALAKTERITVGLGLMPVPLRNVALAAMEIAALDRMFPGRFKIAIGHGVQEWMGQVGQRAQSPLTLMREHLTAMNGLLSGDEVTVEGEYVSLDRVQLGWVPAERPQILVGAIGPKTLRIAGELADGVLLDADLTPETLADSIALCRDARANSDRAKDPFEVCVYVRAYRGEDALEQLQNEAKLGLWESGVANDADATAHLIHDMWSAGADSVILMPSGTDPSPSDYFRYVAKLRGEAS